MKLNLIIPTYNRSAMLQRTLASVRAADIPEGLDVSVTVVDNNSPDDTRSVVEAWQKRFDGRLAGRLAYLFERQQGRSPAVNAGIQASQGDLIGMIDDDEEIHANWFTRAAEAFRDENVDFIGGPNEPNWESAPPTWFPDNYRGVVGWVDGGTQVRIFGADYEGILMGGNAVVRRSVFERVGLYSTSLGRTDKHLLSCEDEDFFMRLLAAGMHGLYLPDLIIYHHIPNSRLTKRYFRQWCFWRGVSKSIINRERPEAVTHLARVPRYLYGNAARGLAAIAAGTLRPGDGQARKRFGHELAVWDLAGFFYGTHFYRPGNPAGETEKKMKEQTAL